MTNFVKGQVFDRGPFLQMVFKGSIEKQIVLAVEKLEAGAMNGAVKFEALGDRMLETDVRNAGLGTPLSKSWRSNTYPHAPARSLSPAVRFDSGAPKIKRAFQDAVTIKGKTGNWLAIPTEAAPARGSEIRKFYGRGEIVAAVERIYGPLKFVPVKGKAMGLLVTDPNRGTPSGRQGRDRIRRQFGLPKPAEGVVMFVLIRKVKMPKLLSYREISRRFGPLFADIMARELSRASNGAAP